MFLLDSAKDISPHNYRTIALLNSFLAFFDGNFFFNVYISSSCDKQHDITRNVTKVIRIRIQIRRKNLQFAGNYAEWNWLFH